MPGHRSQPPRDQLDHAADILLAIGATFAVAVFALLLAIIFVPEVI